MNRTCNFKLVDFGSLRALVDITFDSLEIKGFKVIDSGEGNPWVAPPSREVIKDGEKRYYDVVRFSDDDAKHDFQSWVLKAYRKEVAGTRNGNGNGKHRQ